MRRLMLVVMACGAAACGGKTPAGSAADNARPTPALRRDNNVVMGDEILRHGGHNLHEVLRALRPAWFRSAPTRMTTGAVYADAVSVYIDGRRIGTPANLSEIPVSQVIQVRFYSASEAQGRFGLDNLQGAIDVITSR